MNKQSFTFLIALATLALIAWFFLYPAWQGLAQSRQNLAFWQEKVAEAEQAKQTYLELAAEYELFQNEETKIMDALPEEGELPSLLVQLEALASQNGLILNSINFVYPEKSSQSIRPVYSYDDEGNAILAVDAAGEQASFLTSAKTITIDLGLNGNFAALKNFLKAVENNLRLTDVDSISFSSASGGQEITGSAGKLSVKLKVYFKE